MKTEKKRPKMATSTLFDTENENLFQVELNEDNNQKLPIELFQELEVELLETLLHQVRTMKLMVLLAS